MSKEKLEFNEPKIKEVIVSSEILNAFKEREGQSLINKSNDKLIRFVKEDFYRREDINFASEFMLVDETTGESLKITVEGAKPKFLSDMMIIESKADIDREIANWKNEAWLIAKAEEEIAKLEQKKANLKVGSVLKAPSVNNIKVG